MCLPVYIVEDVFIPVVVFLGKAQRCWSSSDFPQVCAGILAGDIHIVDPQADLARGNEGNDCGGRADDQAVNMLVNISMVKNGGMLSKLPSLLSQWKTSEQSTMSMYCRQFSHRS